MPPSKTPNVDAAIEKLPSQLVRPPVWAVVEMFCEDLGQGLVHVADQHIVFTSRHFRADPPRLPAKLECVQVHFDANGGVANVVPETQVKNPPKSRPSKIRSWYQKLLGDSLFGVRSCNMNPTPEHTDTLSWFKALDRRKRKNILAALHESRTLLRHSRDLQEALEELLGRLEDEHHSIPAPDKYR
jgi:hypothetical protein